MCSPKVAQIVNERIAREGGAKVSRRGFLTMGGALAAAAGFGVAVPGRSVSASAPRSFNVSQVIDLSHPVSPSFPVFPAFQPAEVKTLVSVEEDGFYAQQWTFGEHTSTHMDFPAHFVAGGAKLDEVEANVLVGQAVVIDISDRVNDENEEVELLVEDIEAWEQANGEIPEGAFVFMYSGWESRLAEEGKYLNVQEDGVMRFPGFSVDAAKFLAENRNIHGVGVDTLSLDVGSSATFEAHFHFLSAGILGVEAVANLLSIKDKNAMVICGVPLFEHGSGGPARVLALVSE